MSVTSPILDAIAKYYGKDSNIYTQLSSIASTGSLEDLTSALRQVPGVTIDTAPSGTWLGWSFDASMGVSSAGAGTASAVNSNVANSLYGNSFGANVPISVASDGGQLVVQGAKKGLSSTAIAVADRVSLGVIGVNIGAKLGKAVDSALYNLAPDWWDEHYPTINPETWTDIAGESETGRSFIRTLFDIDDNGNTTAYVPEEMIAQTYQLLRDVGALREPSITVDAPEGVALTWNWELPLKTSSTPIWVWRQAGRSFRNTDMYTGPGVVVAAAYNNGTSIGYMVINDEPFTIHKETTGRNPGSANYSSTVRQDVNVCTNMSGRVELYGQTGYYEPNTSQWGNSIPVYNKVLNYTAGSVYGSIYDDMAKIWKYGEKHITGAYDGINYISGAPQYAPDNITGTDLSTVLQQLKTEYPDLFQNPITESVPQPDGTTKTITYYPIPWQNTDPSDLSQESPVTVDHPTTSTTINPEDAEKIISKPRTLDEPEVSPDDGDTTPPPSYPTTGDGSAVPPIIPTGTASALWSVYNPSQAELNSFGAWLWSNNFIDNILRIFASPMDGVIGLHKIFATPTRGSSRNIAVGYLDSGVSSLTVPSQYVEVDCGTVSCPEFFGNVFDYDPYTKISLYLPFIGVVPLKTSEVMRSRINVKYGVDVYTGACLAKVLIIRDHSGAILYSFGGDAAVHYPMSAGNYSGLISSITGAAMAALGVGMTAMGAPAAGGLGAAAAGAKMLTGSRGLSVQHSGGFSGNSGAMGPKKPYLIIERPQTNLAESFDLYDGKPANFTVRIGDCVKYIRCKEVHLHCPDAYKSEVDEIERLLKSGVIVS